ncbi:putative cation-transporting ATPase 13A4 [Mantella aurantiaca]
MGEKYAVLNQGEENEMELFGYNTKIWRNILCYTGYLLSLGFLRILFYWKPELDVWCNCAPCSLATADVVLLRSTDDRKQYTKKRVIVIQPTVKGEKPCHQLFQDENSVVSRSIMKPKDKVRYFKVQKLRYVWVPSVSMFKKIGVLDENLSCADVHTKYGFGLSEEEQDIRRQICGFNTITVKVIPIWKLLFKEILNPFYVFQAYSLSIWMALSYIEYSIAIILMTFVSISATIYNLRKQSVKLHKMSASYNSIMVKVLHKNGEVKEVQSQSLVPGDIIVLGGNKLFLPCDAILLSGGCTVNEAMLTGESVPVTKTPLPNIDNSIPWMAHSGDDYKRHVLFCGTEVIQTKGYGHDLVKAVVLQTGFNTAKGDLVRFIIYNKSINVKLNRDAFKFLSVPAFVVVCLLIYTVILFEKNGASVHDIVLMSFVMLTAGVNAVLPATITMGLLYGQTRLKKLGIFCISPQRINLAGQLNLVCFDKTGTLTEDVLDLRGILPCENSRFQEMILLNSSNNLPWSHILQAMASCHSLIKMEGKLNGDPLDLKMFEGTGWELEDYLAKMVEDGPLITCTIARPGSTAGKVPVEGIVILHQFPFSSSVQRMSVITQVIGESDLTVIMKGAPEIIIRYCKPDTVPDTFNKQLDLYTKQGFRVIGLAFRSLQKEELPLTSDLEREVVETDLEFLGLLILENRLKPETNSVLKELGAANIRTVMVTGDNLQTAVTVGKTSGMIPDNSDIILLEACEPDQDLPASLTWKSMTEETFDNNLSKPKEELQININGGWINNPTVQGNFHFVLTGSSYQVISQYFYNLLPKILLNGTIFARMMPKQKSSLVEELQKLDYFVGMCGDGANDCGALKMSHAGISLSELEASVASPFTSKIPNIRCVPMLIKEGRNTLVTTFSIFKFMTMFIFVGLSCVAFLFWKQTLLGNYQYLLQDLAINLTVALTLSLNGPAPKLAPYRPQGQLLSPPLLLSIAMHLTFTVIIQTTAFLLLQQQPWYNETDVFSACLPLNHSMENVTLKEHRFSENFLTTTMFPITGFNFIILEFVFSKGRPFRQRLYTNYLLTCLMILQVTVYGFMLFADIEAMYTTLELVCVPYYWRVNIVIMMIVLLILSYLGEEWFIENRNLWLWIKRIFKYKSKSQYRKLQQRVKKDSEWPPKNKTDYSIQTLPVKATDIISSKPIYSNSPHYGKNVISEHTIVTAM